MIAPDRREVRGSHRQWLPVCLPRFPKIDQKPDRKRGGLAASCVSDKSEYEQQQQSNNQREQRDCLGQGKAQNTDTKHLTACGRVTGD